MTPSDWPALSISLPAEASRVREIARAFALDEIAPIADRIEGEGSIPGDLWPKMGSAGLLGVTVDPLYGGSGFGYLEHLVAMEEISRASAAVGLSYLVHSHACANQIQIHGSEEQRRRFLPGLVRGTLKGGLAITELLAGSDALALRTHAERVPTGYRLNGHKAWIANAPCADVMVVYARTGSDAASKGINAFILERTTAGYRTGEPRDTLGVRGCPVGDIWLDNCEVPDSSRLGAHDDGRKILLGGLALERLVACGGPIGLMQACVDLSVPHCRTRRQFGEAIGSFQLVQGKLAEMLTSLNAARAYAYAVGVAMSRNEAHRFDSAGLLLFAGDRVMQAASDAVQLFGAAGYDGRSTAARLFRDAKFFSIGFGTSEIRRVVLGRELLRGP